MDDWFKLIRSSCELASDDLDQILEDGFVVLPPRPDFVEVAELAVAYDVAVSAAAPIDVHKGRTGRTMRVSDFVNRGPEFDELYLYGPILAACCTVIGRPFKLSTMHARTLNPDARHQDLHVDFPRDQDDRAVKGWPMIGFIIMIDEFRDENGATRFVSGSHVWNQSATPSPANDVRQVSACGPAGSVIIYNGSTWHGHGANNTGQPRRSIQGAYIRRDGTSGADLPSRMTEDTLGRIGPLAKYVLAI